MKKIIILLTLVTIPFLADKRGDPTPDGWILYPTFEFSITNGKLSYYYRGELWDVSEDAKGRFGTETNLSVLLPVTKNISLFSNYAKTKKHLTIFHTDAGTTRQIDGDNPKLREESWYTIALGMRYRFTPPR